jgi:hypothetical protein
MALCRLQKEILVENKADYKDKLDVTDRWYTWVQVVVRDVDISCYYCDGMT